jgi:type I restriction-modification system DNA methylase subunit
VEGVKGEEKGLVPTHTSFIIQKITFQRTDKVMKRLPKSVIKRQNPNETIEKNLLKDGKVTGHARLPRR